MEERVIKGRNFADDMKTLVALIYRHQERPDGLLVNSQDPENDANKFVKLGGIRSTDDQGRVVIDWRGFHMTLIPITEGEFA